MQGTSMLQTAQGRDTTLDPEQIFLFTAITPNTPAEEAWQEGNRHFKIVLKKSRCLVEPLCLWLVEPSNSSGPAHGAAPCKEFRYDHSSLKSPDNGLAAMAKVNLAEYARDVDRWCHSYQIITLLFTPRSPCLSKLWWPNHSYFPC